MKENVQQIVFAGGCFWCTEAIFRRLRGVETVHVGYAGGSMKNPPYEAVSSGSTGHAEAVQVEFDPSVISLETLLSVFFATHDPTSLNRQGADVGTQYRSAIFYASEEQRATVDAYIKKLEQEKTFSNPIVTEIKPLDAFYEAEGYHQEYYEKNAGQPYCQVVIDPKIAKLRRQFAPFLKESG